MKSLKEAGRERFLRIITNRFKVLGLRLRLRSRFSLRSEGYLKFLKITT
jgi:hypothetical protein